MNWKRVSAVAGSTAAFVAAVAVGALAIVSLSPGERPVLPAQQGLLIENATALKPFESRAKPAVPQGAPRPQGIVAEAEIAELREPALSRSEPPPASAPGEAAPRPAEPRGIARSRAPFHEVPSARAPAAETDSGPVQEAAPPPRQRVAALPKAEPRTEPRTEPRPEARPPRPLQAALPSAQPPPGGVLTPAEIRRMRLSLRLTREQEPYWPPLEQALLEISAQQSAMVRAGQDPKEAFGIGTGMRIYSVARPFLDQLREDQKAQVRARARAMGFGSIASQI